MNYAIARDNMVRSQVRPNKVTDERVLAAMSTLPRELFVPPALRGIAYVDEDIALGGGRFLMEPAVLARLIQAAEIGGGDVVLDVGCGTGYSAAILSSLANTVVALECDKALAARAGEILRELGIDNVVLLEGELADGYPKQAPYQAIVLDGAVEAVPARLGEQLADGGHLVAVVGVSSPGRATVMTRTGGVASSRVLFEAAVGVLPGFAGEPRFVF